MDAFYASVEQRDYPELRGRPVAVGGRRSRAAWWPGELRGARLRRALGHPDGPRAAPVPGLVIVRPDFARYRAVSQQVMAILHSCTPLVEPLSLDEAYLDVTDNLWGEPLASNVAKKLKALIRGNWISAPPRASRPTSSSPRSPRAGRSPTGSR